MKKWMQKLADQLDLDWKKNPEGPSETPMDMSEEQATILYILDVYNKHLIDIETQPVRKVRETLDAFAKEILKPDPAKTEKVLFRLRQFLSSYRIDEYTYIQKTFDDFRGIIWDFVDQLAAELSYEQGFDGQIQSSFEQLKEAVESNSIDVIKSQSRQFIDSYIEHQTHRDRRRSERIENIRRNLHSVKKQLVDANNSLKQDHLTGAFNRKSFDEQVKNYHNLNKIDSRPICMIMLDIDFFKKINDTYGHAMGDFVLVECVKMLKECFSRPNDFLARVGGEEFAIILPEMTLEGALTLAETALTKIRNEAIVQEDMRIKFTLSMGIAALVPGETPETWMKRADAALYDSKNTGRNKYTVAPAQLTKKSA